MATNTLTDARCRAAKPQERAYKLFDGGGLALWVSTTGARIWRLHYRRRTPQGAKPATMSLGPYPDVSLADARRLRDEARAKLREGGDPMAQRRRARTAMMTLRQATDAYWQGRQDVTDAYRRNVLRCCETHIHPALGERAIASIERAELLAELMRMDAAGLHDYVRKARLWLSAVWGWAIEHDHASANPAAAIDPRKAFGQRHTEHFAAVQPHEVRDLLQRLSLEDPALQSMLACRFLACTWLRTGEMRTMLWTDLVQPDMLVLPAARMKRRRDHLVPLPRQAVAIIENMRARSLGSRFVWPGDRTIDRPMSENAVLYLLHRAGYRGRMTGHGWRSTGSTWANEAGYSPDAIEMQLAHHNASVRAVYNRALYLDERRRMLQAWADWLDRQASPTGGDRPTSPSP